MIYLHKILPVFLSPILIVLALLVIGAVTRRRVWIVGGFFLLYVASTPLVSEVFFKRIENNFERLTPTEIANADAIVELSAGMGWVKTKQGYIAEWPTPSRFLAGIDLFEAGKAPLLVFTGGKLPWQRGDETEGDVLKRYAERMQVPADKVLVSSKAANTEQEALGVKDLLDPLDGNKAKTIILVTAAFHMPRAQRLFENVGFNVLPYPVNFRVEAEDLTVMSFLPDVRSLQATHTAIHEMLGRLYYRVKHL